MPLVCWGVPPPFCLSLLPFYSSFLPLNGVPKVGTCPINPSLQLLEVVVKAEKYDCVRLRALNTIMATFPLNASVFPIVFFCFSIFPVPRDDLECHYQWQIVFIILGYIHAEEDSPHAREGVFSLGWALGPMQTLTWASRSFTPPPPHNSPSKSCFPAPRTERRVLVTSGLNHGLPSLVLH